MKRRTWLAKGYGSLATAWRTLRGIEAMDMVRKGRVRRIAKGDPVWPSEVHRQVVRCVIALSTAPSVHWSIFATKTLWAATLIRAMRPLAAFSMSRKHTLKIVYKKPCKT